MMNARKLPQNMEARPLKRGGFSYRVLMPDGRKVNLGWNFDEAMERYRDLFAAPDEDGIDRLAKDIHDRHRKGAKQRGIGFDLDLQAVKRLLRAQRLRCAVTGRRFSLEPLPGVRARPYAPSLDRIKSTEPYTEENCRLVCAAVNAALSDLGDEQFQTLFEPLIRRLVREEVARILAGMMIRQPA